MNQEEAITNWLTYDNLVFLLQTYKIKQELFEEFRFYLNKILTIHNCFDNNSDISINDSFISFECENSYCMEDGNEDYCTFRYIEGKIYIIRYIGTKISTKCGYINDYPEDVISNFLNILKLSFQDLKFIDNNGIIEIFNFNKNTMDFIQHLFLMIRNIQNPEFNFTQWLKSGGVEDRKESKENEFSSETKALIRENANHCCESCGILQLKPDHCKKNKEKYNSKKNQKLYGYIDHINEHRFGGTKDFENGQLLCHDCHSIKTRMFSKTKIFSKKNVKKFSGVSIKSSIKKISKKKNY
jgi:hypothetical protein